MRNGNQGADVVDQACRRNNGSFLSSIKGYEAYLNGGLTDLAFGIIPAYLS